MKQNVNEVEAKNVMSFDYSFLARTNIEGFIEDRPLVLGNVLGSLYSYPQSVSICEYNEFLERAKEQDPFIKDSGSAFFDYGFVYVALKRMTGDIFTVLDASLDSSPKSKAMKDLIRKALKERAEWVAEMAFYRKCPSLDEAVKTYKANHREWDAEAKISSEKYEMNNSGK